jgi:hypothetical protein
MAPHPAQSKEASEAWHCPLKLLMKKSRSKEEKRVQRDCGARWAALVVLKV